MYDLECVGDGWAFEKGESRVVCGMDSDKLAFVGGLSRAGCAFASVDQPASSNYSYSDNSKDSEHLMKRAKPIDPEEAKQVGMYAFRPMGLARRTPFDSKAAQKFVRVSQWDCAGFGAIQQAMSKVPEKSQTLILRGHQQESRKAGSSSLS